MTAIESGWTRGLAAVAAVAALAAAPPPQLDHALSAQRQLAEERPDDSQVLNDLGNLLYLTGDLEAAREVYERAMAAGPEAPDARYNLALLLHETGERRRALGLLERLVRDHPGHAWGHYHAGLLQHERGRTRRAVRHYTRALALEPRLEDPRFNPHAVGNELLVRAVLRAQGAVAASTWSPRLYAQPGRIAGLLLPVVPRPPAEEAPEAPEAPPEEAPAQPPPAKPDPQSPRRPGG